MDLFTLGMALAKQQVKQLAKNQVKNVTVDIMKKGYQKKMVNDQFVFYRSSKTVNSMAYQQRDYMNAFDKLTKLTREANFSSLKTASDYNSYSKMYQRMSERQFKMAFNEGRIYKLSDSDMDMFLRSQFNKEKGSISPEHLSHEKHVFENVPLKYVVNDKDYYNIDLIIQGHSKNDSIDFNSLDKIKNEDFKKKITDRMKLLEEAKLIDKNGVFSKEYKAALTEINSKYNSIDYRVYNVLKENGNMNAVKDELKNAHDFAAIMNRIDYLKKNEFLSLDGDKFILTDKFHTSNDVYIQFLKNNAKEHLDEKLAIFEKMGLVNKSNDSYFVTDIYFNNYMSINQIKNYKSEYFSDRLINLIDNRKPLSEVKDNFVKSNELSSEFMSLKFDDTIKILKESGIIQVDLENDSIELLRKVKTKDLDIGFNYYDVNLYRNFDANGTMDINKFNNLEIPDKRRLYKHLNNDLVTFSESGLSITDEGKKIEQEFLSGIRKSRLLEGFKYDKVTEYLSEKGTFKIEDLLSDDFLNESYKYLKNQKKVFEFGKYDANVILKSFKNPISMDDFEENLKKTIADEKFAKELSIRTARINKLIDNGYLLKDEKGLIHISNLGTEASKELAGFSFSEYDRNVLFKFIENNNGVMNQEELKNELSKIYKEGELEYQLSYNLKRIESNVEFGTIQLRADGYSVSPKGIEIVKDIQRSATEHIETALKSKLSYLEHLGFVEEKNGLYSFTEAYKASKDLKSFVVSNLDVNLYKKLTENKTFNLQTHFDELKDKLTEKEFKRQSAILNGRFDKLDKLGLVFHDGDIYRATEKFDNLMKEYERFKHVDKDIDKRSIEQNDFKFQSLINNFTFNNVVAAVDQNKIWTVEKFKEIDPELSNVDKVTSHLDKLTQMGYALKVDEGYLIHDEVFERSNLLSLSRERRITEKQKEFLIDLRDFQSLTQSQANKYIYENANIAQYSMDELVRKGIIDFKLKRIDDEVERIYYLKSKGKKTLIELTGEDKQAFDAKILSRPQEVKHDLYVYSAYQDSKKELAEMGYKVVDVKTDKDIRSLLNSGKLTNNVTGSHKTDIKIEFADLYIEYENPITAERGFVNIEVDVGYTPDVIKSKAEKIDNLAWYTDSEKQMEKIMKVDKTAIVKVISL